MERDLSHRAVWRACLRLDCCNLSGSPRDILPTMIKVGRGFSVFKQKSEMGQQGIQHTVLSAVLPHPAARAR
jgi:hypothetical protein